MRVNHLQNDRHVLLGRWLGYLISLVLLVWIACTFDLAEVGRTLVGANYIYLLPVAVLMIVNFSIF